MKKHQVIFQLIKKMLSEQFGEKLNEYEDGKHLSIDGRGIWLSADDTELTIGYGLNHRHYVAAHDDISEAVDNFINLLTGNRRTTKYFKGNCEFKNKLEIENINGEFHTLSTSATWLFPFWKKTHIKVVNEPSIINRSSIEKDIAEIEEYMRSSN